MNLSPDCALPQSYNFSIRRVAMQPAVPPSPCYRFTGSGDRPCDEPYTPMKYALAPWTYPVRPDAMLLYWSWSRIDTHNPLVYVDLRAQPMAFPDGSWVEVARYAERTSYVGSDGGGYGVWYWLVPGSGVSVNIGRALRFKDKREAIHWANHHHPKNTTLKCMDFDNDSCDTHPDALFCAAARFHSYDSVIVRRDWIKFGHVSGSRSDVIELIVCPPTEPPEQILACPPSIEHRLAGGLARCTCNASAELLACEENGHTGSYPMVGDYGTRPIAVVGLASAAFVGGPIALGMALLALGRRLRVGNVAVRSGKEHVIGDAERPLIALGTRTAEHRCDSP